MSKKPVEHVEFKKGDWVVRESNYHAQQLYSALQVKSANERYSVYGENACRLANKSEIRKALAEEFALFASDFYEEWSNAATRKGMTSLYNRVKSLLGEVEKGA